MQLISETVEPTKLDQTKPAMRGRSANTASGCTPKQDKFAECIAKGMTQAQSYREAYGQGNMKDASLYRRALDVMDNVKVQARVAWYRDKMDRKERSTSHDPVVIRAMLLDYFIATVQDEKVKASDRNKAAELLGKVRGVALFTEEPKDKTEQLLETTALNTLKQRLQKLMADDTAPRQQLEAKAVLVRGKPAPSAGGEESQ